MDSARSLTSRVAKFIETHDLLPVGSTVIAGVSGGPDSMCLLDILWRLSGEYGWRIVAAHVNHLLREEESDRDEEFVHERCIELGIPFRCHRIDVLRVAEESGDSLETAARNVRYRFFQDIAGEEEKAVQADNSPPGDGSPTTVRIAIAHHREDQAETLLMHLFRGSGIDGLSGMAPLSGRIARPLLEISRTDILAYLSAFQGEYRTDSTNLCSDTTRNRVRLEMIPLAASIFGPDPCARLAGTAALLREDALYLDSMVRKILADLRLRQGEGIDVLTLSALPSAMANRVVRALYAEITGTRTNLGRDHASAVRKLAAQTGGRAFVSLPGRIIAVREDGAIRFEKAHLKLPIPVWAPIPLSLSGWTETPVGRFFASVSAGQVRDAVGDGACQAAFCFSALSGADVRTRRIGDRIRPVVSSGSRSLKRFLVDRHVPAASRGRLPMVAVGDKVAWIPGIVVSSGHIWVPGRDSVSDCIWLAYCPQDRIIG